MRKLSVTICGAWLVAALIAPAAAQEATEPTFRTERVYFKCIGGDKVQNVHRINGAVPTWDTTPPAQSVQQGAGCGQYENLQTGGGDPSPHDLVFEGKFTGNLDALTVELHTAHLSSYRANNRMFLTNSLFIDDEEVHATGFFQFPTVDSSTGITQKLTWTYQELNYADELGDGTQEHTVRLVVRSANEEQSIWVWDTTEVPAGLTFNPAAPEATKFFVGRG